MTGPAGGGGVAPAETRAGGDAPPPPPHQRLSSTESPTNNNNNNNNNNLDPNNAAYLALRNHPETTIRAVNDMRSENESPRNNMEENIFKQVNQLSTNAIPKLRINHHSRDPNLLLECSPFNIPK